MGHYLDAEFQHEKWYRVEDPEVAAQLLLRDARRVFDENGARYGECRSYASIFEGLALTSFEMTGYRFDDHDAFGDALDAPVLKNTIRSTGMTLVAKLCANDTPLSQFMTNRGGWQESVKAVRMGRLVDAEVEQPQGIFSTLHEMHRHGATLAINVTGSYMIFFFPGDDGVRCELDDTLAVGIEVSGRFGRIVSLVRTVWRDADELAADFPDYEDQIYEQEEVCLDGSISLSSRGNHDNLLKPRRGVRVVQGWFLKYKGVMGREMWVLEGDSTILRDRDYDRKHGPWVKWDFERSLYSVWGTPMTRTIYEMAMRENRMLCDMDAAERNSPQCLLILPENAEKEGDLDEARGWSIIRSNVPANQFNFATPPKYNQMSADFVDRLGMYCENISGVSNQQAAAKKAVGTTSGKHEHMVASLFSERFADQERRLIQVRAVDTAKRIVEAMEELLEENPEFSRVWARGDKAEEIKASDLDLDASKYSITVAPVSEDKDTPKARLEKAYEMLQQGLITGSDYAALTETFATQEESNRAIAEKAWVEKQIDKWLHSSEEQRADENFYQGPTEWLDLPTVIRQVSLAQLQARSREAPPEILEYFDKFLAECSDYMDEDAAQAQTSISTDAAGAATIFPGIADQQAAPAAPTGAPIV
jgi:hypothetical protein